MRNNLGQNEMTSGLDINRGRPLPAIGTTEEKLQQRKLHALNLGIHRIKDQAGLVYGVHLVGVGSEGAKVVETFLHSAPKDILENAGSRFTALAVDIGDEELHKVRAAASNLPDDKSQVETLCLEMSDMQSLQETLSHYAQFLKLEYPLYHQNPDSTKWLAPETPLHEVDGSIPRAVAKAVYGQSYYDAGRPALAALRRFARSVERTGGDSIICIVFGLGDSVGSGIAPDLARHLSSRLFGRRMLVAGIGIAPRAESMTQTQAAQLHTVFSELDVLCDETKNRSVEVSCGDLYKNPFTAGFMVVPQDDSVDADQSFDAVCRRISMFVSERRGANLWEALRLLNWVAAPSTQHSAARTPWGSRWIHMVGFGPAKQVPDHKELRDQLGIRSDYRPEFLELRVSEADGENIGTAWTSALDEAFEPEVPSIRVTGASDNTVQYLLPRMALTDLSISFKAQQAYDAEPPDRQRAHHSLLLDQGMVLCQPSQTFAGMAGANTGDGPQWLAIPLNSLRRDAP